MLSSPRRDQVFRLRLRRRDQEREYRARPRVLRRQSSKRLASANRAAPRSARRSGALTAMVEAVVLAGGLGTRLRPLVNEVPKPMAPINGRPFLELLLEYWIDQGVRRFVISVGYLAGRIREHF